MREYLLFLVFAIVFVSGCANMPDDAECSSDSGCVPASCCHSSECVPASEAPNCEGRMCSMECKPGTLDCGQGFCECMNSKCRAVLK